MPTIYQTDRERLILYRLEEAARYIGVSSRTLRQYIKDQRLPAQKIGGIVYIWDQNLSAFVRGAHTTHTRNTVPAPTFAEDFPPDPFLSAQDQDFTLSPDFTQADIDRIAAETYAAALREQDD